MIWTDEDGFLLKPLGISSGHPYTSKLFMDEKILHFLTIFLFVSSEPGRLMARYYLKFDTMKLIMQVPMNCTLENALNVICHAEEIACKYTSSSC